MTYNQFVKIWKNNEIFGVGRYNYYKYYRLVK